MPVQDFEEEYFKIRLPDRRDHCFGERCEPASAPLPVRPSLLPLRFCVNENWSILSFDAQAAEQFAHVCDDPSGRDLRSLLVAFDPAWEVLLPGDVEGALEEGVFLPGRRSENPGLGLRFDAFRGPAGNGGLFFVTLTPALAPEIAFRASEEGLSEDAGSAFHHLFLRTQQIELRFRQFMRCLPGAAFTQRLDLSFSVIGSQLGGFLGEVAVERLRAGECWTDWIHSDDRKEFEKNVRLCRDRQSPVTSRLRLNLPEGRGVLYLMEIRIPVRSVSGTLTGFEGMWLDLTPQTLAEKRLQKAAWKESLAEISSSLSHDFNNVMTGISALSEMVLAETPAADPNHGNLRTIMESADQAQRLIQRIVSLNREETHGVRLQNLCDIVRNQVDLIRILLPKSARFELHLPEEELAVNVDDVAIRRILLNFASNARDAIRRRGRVDLYVRRVDLAEYPRDHLFSSRCKTSGPAVELVFKDDGCGIDECVLHRIFDPYFSTKERQRGSGLGLYSMKRFAEQNSIDFGVRSKPGVGTEMILLIPEVVFEEVEDGEAFVGDVGPGDIQGRKPAHVAFFCPPGAEDPDLAQLFQDFGWPVLADTDEAIVTDWIQTADTSNRILVVVADHRKVIPPAVANLLAEPQGILRVLQLRGCNPDEIDGSYRDRFDVTIESASSPRDNVEQILSRIN